MTGSPVSTDQGGQNPAANGTLCSGLTGAIERLRQGEFVGTEERNWSDERLVGADLDGLDLSDWQLDGVDLSRCSAERSRWIGARLSGAVLFEAKLDRAELSGAQLDGADLTRAQLERAGLGRAQLQGVQACQVQLAGAAMQEADLSGANLQAADLSGARLAGACLRDCDLSAADLRGADLSGADVRGARFDNCRLDGALLRGVRGFERASWLGLNLQGVDFTGAHMLRSFILDQNYLDEFRRKSPGHRILYWLWWVTSDCGRSAIRWGVLTLTLVVTFAWVLAHSEVDYGPYETPLSPLYTSVVTLTTLGYGDALPMSMGAQVVVMAEVLTGYMLLGGLLSLFSNQMARRAE